MSNHHRRPSTPSEPFLNFRTTSEILRQTASIFWSHLLTFLFLAFLILIFRSNVDNGTHLLTRFIDRDPSLKALFNHLHISGDNHYSQFGGAAPRRPRRRLLHLTRVGTIDDDFFSGDEDNDRPLFGSNPKTPSNSSFLIYSSFGTRLGFPNYVTDNGIKMSEIASSSISFKFPGSLLESSDHNNSSRDDDLNTVKNSENQDQSVVKLDFLVMGLELPRRDVSTLFFLVCLLSTAYGYVTLWFLVTYCSVFGSLFLVVVNHFLGKRRSCIRNLSDGSSFGLARLCRFVTLRWALRDALTQLLGLWFFGDIEDQYWVFKTFVRLKLMPFSVMSPWIQGFERESAGFLFAWFLLDMVVEFAFAVDFWVAIVNSRRSGKWIVKEGCYLLLTMFDQAFSIRSLEYLLCGPFTRLVVARYFGKLFGAAFHSLVEVYFLTAWLIYYLAARSKDASFRGRTFGRRELEGFIRVRR